MFPTSKAYWGQEENGQQEVSPGKPTAVRISPDAKACSTPFRVVQGAWSQLCHLGKLNLPLSKFQAWAVSAPFQAVLDMAFLRIMHVKITVAKIIIQLITSDTKHIL